MKHITYCIIFIACAVFISGCRIKRAKDKLEDAMEDAMKEDGRETCGEILESVYESLQGCSEDGVLKEGQTTSSAAEQWCQDNCDNLDNEVDYEKYNSCKQSIWDLECDKASSFINSNSYISECSWIGSTLDC